MLVKTLSLAIFTVPIAMALELSVQNEELQIKAKNLAIIQPTKTSMWLVSTSAKTADIKLENLRSLGVEKIERLDVNSGQGVRLVFSRPMPWQVGKQGDKFTLKRGKQVAKTGSLIMLENNIVLPTELTTVLTATSRELNKRLQIVPVNNIYKLGVAGEYAGLKIIPSLLGAGFGDSKKIENGANSYELSLGELTPNIPQNVVAIPSPLVLKEEGNAEEKIENLPTLQVTAMPVSLTGINNPHNPSAEIEFTLPDNYVLNAGKTSSSINRERAFAGAFGAVAEALSQVDKIEKTSFDSPQASISKTGIIESEVQELEEEIEENLPTKAISKGDVFLLKLSKEQQESFRMLEGERLVEVIKAKRGSDVVAARLNLARLYLSFRRYPEAEGVIKTLPINKIGQPKSSLAKVLLAAVLVLENKGAEALPLLESAVGIEPHRTVWLAAAQTQVGDYKNAVKNFAENIYEIPFYPAHILTFLQIKEAEALLKTQQYAVLSDKMGTIAAGTKSGKLPPDAKYILAHAYLELGEDDRGRRLLAETAESAKGPLEVKAKIDFVLDLHRTQELGKKQVINFLEDLRFAWRGDDLEGKMLSELGNLYRKSKNYRLSLNRYKTYIEAFPHANNLEAVTENMRKSFIRVFDSKDSEKFDLLAKLGLYYDFRELTPADKRGDELVDNMAVILDQAMLYDRAIDLFERQLKFRAKNPIRKAELAVSLAKLYRRKGRFEEAITTLNKYELAEMAKELVREYALEKSHSYLNLKNYPQAKAAINGWIDDAATKVQVDIAWESEDYAEVVRLLAQTFDTNEHASMDDVRIRTDFMRLAYSLEKMEQKEALIQLVANYKADLKKWPQVAGIVNVYASGLHIDSKKLVLTSGSPLQRIAKQLLVLDGFEQNYIKARAQVEARKKQREVYNEKMDYMEFMEKEGLL